MTDLKPLVAEIRSILDEDESVYVFWDEDHYFVERASLVGKTTDKTDLLVCVIQSTEPESWHR